MSFAGIVTNPKNEGYVKEMLSDIFPVENLQFISDKNIKNMHNIQFEILLIDKEIKQKESMKRVISNADYVILNSDLTLEQDILNDLNLTVITYGFHNKATISVSSIEENTIIVCLQRIIKTIQGNAIEPQEIEIIRPRNIEINCLLGTTGIGLIYEKCGFDAD